MPFTDGAGEQERREIFCIMKAGGARQERILYIPHMQTYCKHPSHPAGPLASRGQLLPLLQPRFPHYIIFSCTSQMVSAHLCIGKRI